MRTKEQELEMQAQDEAKRKYELEMQVYDEVRRIITGRNDNHKLLQLKLARISTENKPHEEKMNDFFIVIAKEHHKILKSFGGSNSKLAKGLEIICQKHFGVGLGENSYAPEPNGFIAKMIRAAENALKTIFEFDTSKKKDTGGATNSACVTDINGKSSQLKPSILDNPSLMRKIKAGYTDRENFGEVIAARIGRHLLSLDKVPEVSLVYDPVRARMSIASKYIDGSKGDLNKYANVDKKEAKRVVYVKATKKPLQKGERSIDSLDKHPGLKEDLARAIVLSAVVGDHDVNPGNMIVAAQADGSMRMCRIDFGHAFNDLLNASEFNGGQVRDKANPILDFFNRSEVGGIGGAESKLWRSYAGFIPSQEIVNALREMAGKFDEKAAKGVDEAKEEFRRAFETMKKFGDEEGILHMKDSLNAICENISISGEKVDNNLPIEEFLDEAFKEIGSFIKKNGDNLTMVANVMQLQVDIDKALIEGKPLDASRLRNQRNDKILWVKTGPEPAFVGTINEYLLHRANQLKQEHPIVHDNYWKNIVKNDPDLGMKKTTAYQEKMKLFKAEVTAIKDEAPKPAKPESIVSNNPLK